MLKHSSALMQPDSRSQGVPVEYLYGLVLPFELNGAVPAAIKDQFDVARNAFSYSWFVYDFSMLAEQQCYFVLEMALRQRVPHDQKAKPGKSSGMNKLLKAARTQKILLEEDFMAPPMPGGGKPMCRLELLPTSRNNLAHGNINLLPQYVLMIMELTAQVLNALFAPKNE